MFVDFSTKLANGYYATIDFRVNDVASVGSIYQNEKGEDEE